MAGTVPNPSALSLACLTCRQRVRKSRGCCHGCYGRHRDAVAAGKATWADLERRGLVAPVQRVGETWRRYGPLGGKGGSIK